MSIRLNRRAFLRSSGGLVLGLPLLDIMLNGNGDAFAQSGGPLPKRYAFVFGGQSIGGDDWPKNQQRINGVAVTAEHLGEQVVLHVAELLDARHGEAGLFEDLALGGLLRGLALLDVALGQREHVAAGGLDDRDLRASLDQTEHDATR